MAKLLVNRVKEFLHHLVSEEQAVLLVSGRVISDKILTVRGACSFYEETRRGENMMAVKLDLEWAYDRFRWDSVAIVFCLWCFFCGISKWYSNVPILVRM